MNFKPTILNCLFANAKMRKFAKYISKVMNSFKINVSKITHTVTDNASNFGKTFRVYTQQFVTPETVSKYNVT